MKFYSIGVLECGSKVNKMMKWSGKRRKRKKTLFINYSQIFLMPFRCVSFLLIFILILSFLAVLIMIHNGDLKCVRVEKISLYYQVPLYMASSSFPLLSIMSSSSHCVSFSMKMMIQSP
jgi:hypothetical protein